MPKSSKRFIISSSVLNSQGFRLLSSGLDVSDFEKNPVLLFNHIRPEGNLKNQILPLGHWEDMKWEGDNYTGVPYFDDKDEFAMSIYHKVEGGHIRMCSAGAEPIETSKNKKDLLPGQKLASVSKSKLKEGSICDIGANPDALGVALYDSNDRLIKLSETPIETLIPKITNMAKKTTTAADAFAALKKAKDAKETATKAITLAHEKVSLALADDEVEEDEKTKLADESKETEELSDDDKDGKIAELTKKLAEVTEQLRLANEKTATEEAKLAETKATTLAHTAHYTDKKISLSEIPHIKKMAISDYQGTVDYLKTRKAMVTLKDAVGNGAGAGTGSEVDQKVIKLAEKSFDELFTSGDLQFIKLNAPDVYKTKYKQKFGKDPKN